jgi:hypothetical protein
MSTQRTVTTADVKLKLVCSVICVIAAFAFYCFGVSRDIAIGLAGCVGGAALGGCLNWAKFAGLFGAPQQ